MYTKTGGRWRTRKRLAALLALTVVAVGSLVGLTPDVAQASDYYHSITEASAENRNWMSRRPDSTKLAAMSIPGTHETLSICPDTACDILWRQTQTQEDHGISAATLTTQLNAGIRAIDIRVRVDRGSSGTLAFTIHHGPFYQKANFTDVLTKLRDFLRANPSETVLMSLKAECNGSNTSCDDAAGFDNTEWRTRVFDSYRYGVAYTGVDLNSVPAPSFDDLFWAPSVNGRAQSRILVPTLGEARGKVVLLGFRGPGGGIYSGYGIRPTTYTPTTDAIYIQDEYEVPTTLLISEKWEKVRQHLRQTNAVWDANRGEQAEHATHEPDAIYVNNTSGSSPGAFPDYVAGGGDGITGVNDFLWQCLNNSGGRCPEFYPGRQSNFGGRETMDRTGIVNMDYPGGKLIDKIIAMNPEGSDPDPTPDPPEPPTNGGVGDPAETHPGNGDDDGGIRPAVPGDHAQCRPDGLAPTADTNTPYCLAYDGQGREWLGHGRSRRVIGYFNGARTGDDGTPYYLVKNIPWSKLTHINYAFATVENNRISVGPPGDDNPAIGMMWPHVPGAGMDFSLPYRGHFNLLTQYKRKHPRVKTLISVGGWAGSTGFYPMTTNADGAVNQTGITAFADSVVTFLRDYGFDGVDIDFEYPTALDQTGNPADWDVARPRRPGLSGAYEALMRTLRIKLDQAAAADNRYYLLTSASSASGYLVRGMENQKALRYQDYANLMTYDFHGSWNDVVGPNAALYDDGNDPELADLYGTPEYQGIGYFNTDWAMHYMRGALQAGRINIGIPYYTRGWRDVEGGTFGLWGTSVGSGCQPGTGIVRPCGNGAVGIENIWHDTDADGDEVGAGVNPLWHAQNLEREVVPGYAAAVGLTPTDPADRLTGIYDRHWDETTRTAWLWNSQKRTFLSIADTQWLDEVIDYVIDNGAGGVMMWELSGDYACPQEVTTANPCGMGYTMTTRLDERLRAAAGYANSRVFGSSAWPPAASIDVSVDLMQYPTDVANMWPIQPKVRITNNSEVTIGGGKNNVISFDLPTSTPALIKDGNWQTGAQGGRWSVAAGHTGPNAETGLDGAFHRVSVTLDYCEIIPAGRSLDIPIIYYIPVTGPVNTTISLGGNTFAPISEHNRSATRVVPPAGGCPAPAWDTAKIYNPASQPVEQVTVKYGGKVWQAKWWTQGNIPGTGPDPDHEPWKLIGPAA